MTSHPQLCAAINPLLAECGLAALESVTHCDGGSINLALHCRLEDGFELFAKYNEAAPAGFFSAEVTGLQALCGLGLIRTPKVLAASSHCLLLEYIAPGTPAADYWESLAQSLAAQHQLKQPAFGFSEDNFCGLTPQPNPLETNDYQFFAEHRLLYQAQLARARGLLSSADYTAVQRLCRILDELIPEEEPCLLHGDLWRGNIHCDQSGSPVLIDPACYWGWREADLAMTTLFGSLPERFYAAYNAAYPLQPDWRERVPLFNLYHLLNHLNLFGRAYLEAVRDTLRQLPV